MCSAYHWLLIGALLATASLPPCCCALSARPLQNFTVTTTASSSDDSCSTTLTCLNGAHIYEGDVNGTYAGRLTLINDLSALKQQSNGVLLYKNPIRMLDPTAKQAASFNTSWVTDLVMEYWDPNNTALTRRGDGMTFVMTADNSNSTVGTPAKCLGIYDGSGRRNSRSIVVEFDTYQNADPPMKDISDNHVSLEFMNITFVDAQNASDAEDIELWEEKTLYTWVEYSGVTQLLEVRISRSNARPVIPVLSYQIDLFDVADEFMYVGFSSGNGDAYSSYYIGNWTFESYGIKAAVVPSKRSSSSVGVTVGASVGAFFVMLLAAVVLLGVRKWRRYKASQLGSNSFKEDPMLQLQLSGMPESFSYKQLSVATRAFSEESKLGQGGFGSVYRGVLPTSGLSVAVKRISADSKQGGREFLAEVSIISQLRHRNLIQLVGWCRDRGKYLLVYELMPNGSLDKALFRLEGQPSALSWKQRFNIVTGTAAALDYLHQGWKQQVIHRDVKASNIMLDDEWNAKLGDFGLARLVDHHGPSATTLVAGTYGYIAPEAAFSGRYTDKTDVFAFGAVILEVACGRKAYSGILPPDETILVDWVWRCLSEGKLLSVVDKRLGDYDVYWMEVVLLLGLLCSHPNPAARPTIRHIVQVLAGDAPVPSVPSSKPATVFERDSRLVRIQDLHSTDTEMSLSISGPSTLVFSSLSRESGNSSTGTSY